MADGQAGKFEAIVVTGKWWGSGARKPPELEVTLSNGTAVIISIDDHGLRCFVFFRTLTEACDGIEVPQWMTGFDGDEMDQLIGEVKEKWEGWWAEQQVAA